MTQRRDLTGQIFSQITVISFSHNDKNGKAMWLCKCDCGKEIISLGNNIVRGIVKSCGCWKAKNLTRLSITHGESGTIVYGSWKAMNNRVNCNPEYIKKGIKVCERYAKDFLAFKNDIGPYDKDLPTLDRTNTFGHYSCGNCEECIKNGWKFNVRWTDIAEQGLNKITTVTLEYKGIIYFLPTLARLHGLKPHLLWERIFRCGWSINDAVEIPILKRFQRKTPKLKQENILN